jgi:cytochrome c peroxidase
MSKYFIVFILFIVSCSKDVSLEQEINPSSKYQLILPVGFPQPTIPSDNPLTQEKIDLGKMLFFDPILSSDSSISCASCHNKSKAWSDGAQFSKGVNDSIGFRNSPALTNVAFNASYFRDGGVNTLENQVIAPISNHLEMNENLTRVVEKLNRNPKYVQLFQKAFNKKPDLFGITRAIACFERTLISGNSVVDKFLQTGDSSVFSESAKRGFLLHKKHCESCHSGFNFTNEKFENIGLYLNYKDKGRMLITQLPEDEGKFRVPTLRNIEYTAPYMHDGSLPTLERVVFQYSFGGQSHKNKSELIKPLILTPKQQVDLVQFLKSLSDEEFIK